MNEISISIKDLKKSFGELNVLEGIDIEVPKGTMLALLGPNGAGKTTTVRILSTLLKPDSGRVTVEGYDVVRDANYVRRNIGLTGQYAAVDEYLTGKENLIMMGELYHLGRKESEKRAEELLKQFNLSEAGERKAKTYSGGMKRRLDLALSLIATPPVLFLDEPTTGLDPRSRMAMWEVIERLKKDGVTILLTTQYLDEADKLADRIVVIDHGKVIAEGTADDLKKEVGDEVLELSIENQEEETVSIPITNGAEGVREILNKMRKDGINVKSITVKKPTLDDVFMRLTGHHAE